VRIAGNDQRERESGTPAGPPLSRRVAVAAAGFSAAAILLIGCGGGQATSSRTTATTPGSGTTVSVPAYNPSRNARQDVVAGACVDGGSHGWTLSGTVTNSSTAKQGYSIVVDFITVPGDTVVATKLVTVAPIEPKTSARWSATGAAPGVKNLDCVIRQSLST
jgi:hypothetical protein